MSIRLMTENSSSVAMMWRPSGVKKASSGALNSTPAGRSLGWGNVQVTRPCGSTITSLSLPSSARSNGPGSTDGSEPGPRCPEPAVVAPVTPAARGPGASPARLGAPDGAPPADSRTPSATAPAVTSAAARVRRRRTLLEVIVGGWPSRDPVGPCRRSSPLGPLVLLPRRTVGGLPAPSLDSLLAPRSVAVIGASDDPDKVGGRPIDYLRRFGFQGAVYPVNPR